MWREDRDSSVSIVTRLWTGRSGVQVMAVAKDFFFCFFVFQNFQIGRGAHPASYSTCTVVFLAGIKAVEA
jgi:hypothetical protein